MSRVIRRWIAALGVAAVVASAPALAADRASMLMDGRAIVAKMVERNPNLQTFSARVHVDVRMLNFPWLSPKLDGSVYFKRGTGYEVVFDRTPFYARNFRKIFADVGDPQAWLRRDEISVIGMPVVGGRQLLELRLVRKKHSATLAYALAFVDPSTYELVRMEWHYTNGGTIVMTQTYRSEGGFDLLAEQHAVIDIPHVRAVAEAQYGDYHANIALGDSIFGRP
jgi:hypothetical protein